VFARPGILQALAPAALLLALSGAAPALFEELKLKGFDIEERIAPRREGGDLPVIVVAVDGASLAGRYGQWPWPRYVVARLVDKIASGKPSVLAVDILFAEPDRYAPTNLAKRLSELPPSVRDALSQLPDNDVVLAASLKAVPTVLGMGASFEPAGTAGAPVRVTPIRVSGPDPAAHVAEFPSLVRSLPVIAAAAAGSAALVGNPDRDGIVRRVPQLVRSGGNLVPGLAAEALRVAVGANAIGAVTELGGVDALVVGGYRIATDAAGRAYPYFAGPQSVPTISAADLFSGSVAPESLAGRIVLLGVTGLGLVDVKETPVGLMQGIEVQAELLRSILAGELLRRPAVAPRLESAAIVLATLVVVFGLPYRRPRLASIVAGGTVALLLGGEFAAFRLAHLLFDGLYPALAALAGFGVMTTASLRAAEAARRRLAAALEREREQKARLEGELTAARAIQMGLLPRPLPRTAEASRVEVHALIETARLVGGDLYDFTMLDRHRLFFAVADVSGKGVDAAIFMAATKTVLAASSRQYGAELDRVFGDANAKIAEASDHIRAEGGRPMFVTVFAAVLDLVSGTVAFASAGHDSPYLLRSDGTPLRLDSEGGPPLGAMDDFAFPLGRTVLRPGDVLLLFTDGVTEAIGGTGTLYTGDRLGRLLADTAPASARAAVEVVRDDLRRFVGAAEQADDITLLAVRWLGPVSEP
jgi:serine phosphatase RsbU (regulator of sigma subunit)/CHASE2 domain-containing sensor protein